MNFCRLVSDPYRGIESLVCRSDPLVAGIRTIVAEIGNYGDWKKGISWLELGLLWPEFGNFVAGI
jgi:hypothetical protein